MAATELTLAQFLTRYPEFSQVDDAVIEAALAEALEEMDADVWGTLYSKGQGALTAHILSLAYQDPQDPHLGQYLKEFKRLTRKAASGYRVA